MTLDYLNKLSKYYKLTIVSCFVSLLIIYYLVLKPTYNYYRIQRNLNNEYKQSIELLNTEALIRETNIRLGNKLDINKENADQGHLLNIIAAKCTEHSVNLIAVPEINTSIQDNMSVQTREIIINGSYNNLMSFVYDLERKTPVGLIASTHYYTKYDTHRKRKDLFLKIYIQNFKMSET